MMTLVKLLSQEVSAPCHAHRPVCWLLLPPPTPSAISSLGASRAGDCFSLCQVKGVEEGQGSEEKCMKAETS